MGTAGMVILVTLVSGLGIHRWNIKHIFVFRPWPCHGSISSWDWPAAAMIATGLVL